MPFRIPRNTPTGHPSHRRWALTGERMAVRAHWRPLLDDLRRSLILPYLPTHVPHGALRWSRRTRRETRSAGWGLRPVLLGPVVGAHWAVSTASSGQVTGR